MEIFWRQYLQKMKTRLLILALYMLFTTNTIAVTAQENDCTQMDISIESTGILEWETCYLEDYASLLIKTSSEEQTDNKIILQKDVFWNYDSDCSPTRFFTLVNGEEIYQQEEYFDTYRILSVTLDKGDNEIEIIIATIPGMTANETCPGLDNAFLKSNEVTGSYELKDEQGEPVCLGGPDMILNDKCERIGNYDTQTGIPLVNNKYECDKLDGTWYADRKLCDSKYAPVEYRFQFGPEPMESEIQNEPTNSFSSTYPRQSSTDSSIIVIGVFVLVIGLLVYWFTWRKRK